MNKDDILEKTLGNRIVSLAKEARRSIGSKPENSRVADSLREMFGLARRSRKSTEDKST